MTLNISSMVFLFPVVNWAVKRVKRKTYQSSHDPKVKYVTVQVTVLSVLNCCVLVSERSLSRVLECLCHNDFSGFSFVFGVFSRPETLRLDSPLCTAHGNHCSGNFFLLLFSSTPRHTGTETHLTRNMMAQT